MKLRNNCTDHTRISRRALRLALAFALATGGCSSLWAGDSLPAAARSLPSIGAAEAELLPYPFGDSSQSRADIDDTTAAKRAGVSRQMVKMLGLARPTQRKEPQPEDRAKGLLSPPSSLPSLALPITPTLPPVNGQVVTASATEERALNTTVPLPALPAADTAPKAETSESLLDIEIPASLAMTSSKGEDCPPQKQSSAPSEKSELKSGPPALPAISAAVSSSGVIQACEPPNLHPTEAVATNPTAAAEVAKSDQATAGRRPDIVRSPQAVNLSVKPPATPKHSDAVSLNFNDSGADDQTNPTGQRNKTPSSDSRGAVLHLSSASDEVKLTTPMVSAKLPNKAGMTAKPGAAEQRPADVLEKLSHSVSSGLRPAVPLSMQESSASTLQARLAATGKTLGPIKAVLASRTTPVMDSKLDSGPIKTTPNNFSASEMYPAEAVARASSNALAVGLQESHTLSTDYTILELSVEHPEVCQLLKTSDRSVSIIGLRPGATRIALISYDSQGERKVDVREIAVGDRAATAINLPELAKDISQTVARMYPKSDVQILADQDQIVVRGFTNYEQDAKKILALVRKTSLAPVVDQLTTSGN